MIRLALLACLLLTPFASAGSAEAPEATDAAGDAGPNGAAAPGHEDVDLLAAWFENEDLDSVDLVIQTGAEPRMRPNTQWVEKLTVRGATFYTGFADFSPFFRGVFLCEDTGGDNLECGGTEGGVAGPTIRLTLPKADLGNATAGDAITIETGFVFTVLGAGVPVINAGIGVGGIQYDSHEAGTPYLLAKGVAANATAPRSPDALLSENATQPDPLSTQDTAAPAENAVPAAPAAGALALAALAALRRRQ